MNAPGDTQESRLERMIATLRRLHEQGRTSRLRKPIFVITLVAFSIGFVVAIRHLPEGIGLVAPSLLLLSALVAVPAAILINTIETRLNAQLVAADLGWLRSAHVGLVSSAANLLPIPGGPLVRIAALKGAGASLLRSGITTSLIAAIWIGLALVFAGAWIVGAHTAVSLLLLGTGAALTVLFSAAILRSGGSWQLVGLLLANKSAAIFVGILRMYWALRSLGVDVSFSQVWVFSLSDVAGSAVSIVPAGLGVNEAIAALMAQLVEVPSAAAFIAVGLNRVIAFPVLFAAMLAVGLLRRRVGANPGETRV